MPLPIIAAAALSLVTEFAPTLIRHFAGDKAGQVAETAANTAKQLTGQDITTTEGLRAAQEALRADKELFFQFQQAMAQIELETEKAYLLDRQDARKRDVDLHKSGYDNKRANWMVFADVFGLVVCVGILAFFKKDIPAEIITLLTTIASIFGLCLRDAHQFEFGSSRGSKEKDLIKANGK